MEPRRPGPGLAAVRAQLHASRLAADPGCFDLAIDLGFLLFERRARLVRRLLRCAARVHGSRAGRVAQDRARRVDGAGRRAVRGEARLGARGGTAAIHRRHACRCPSSTRRTHTARSAAPGRGCGSLRRRRPPDGTGIIPRPGGSAVQQKREQHDVGIRVSGPGFAVRRHAVGAGGRRAGRYSRPSPKPPTCWATTCGRCASRVRKPSSASPRRRSRRCWPPASPPGACGRRAAGRCPLAMAGHSLGEYTALVCSGALDFRDCRGPGRFRGQVMQRAVPLGRGRHGGHPRPRRRRRSRRRAARRRRARSSSR